MSWCIGFHSGPWMSLFGVGMDQAGNHGGTMPDGWVGSVGDPNTTSLSTTKPNHQYICYIATAREYDACARPQGEWIGIDQVCAAHATHTSVSHSRAAARECLRAKR